jgi:enterochelin esterase-like enzyme
MMQERDKEILRLLSELKLAYDNLEQAQARCGKLVEETRELKKKLQEKQEIIDVSSYPGD